MTEWVPSIILGKVARHNFVPESSQRRGRKPLTGFSGVRAYIPKIIELLEEMRRDDPSLHNRVDHEAAAMSLLADPQAVLDAIKDSHEELTPAKFA